MKIAVACGGTGGHIFPGLATGEELRRRGHTVALWLAGKDVEGTAVQGWTGEVVVVQARGLPAGFNLGSVPGAWRMLSSARRCARRMQADAPDVVLGMGSYASVGPVVAGLHRGIPCVLHESNAVPGRAISLLSRWTACTGISFEATRSHLRRRRVEFTGMPLRRELAEAAAAPPPAPPDRPFTVLLMGGSRGAHALNDLGAEAIVRLRGRGVEAAAIHLTGEKDEAEVRERYRRAGVKAEVAAFRHDMAAVYRAADLAVARSGAATCAELCALGVPSLLVPYPAAVRDHQTANARAMERAGAADMVPQRDLSASWLADYLANAARHPARRAAQAAAARAMSSGSGTERLADLVERCGARGHGR